VRVHLEIVGWDLRRRSHGSTRRRRSGWARRRCARPLAPQCPWRCHATAVAGVTDAFHYFKVHPGRACALCAHSTCVDELPERSLRRPRRRSRKVHVCHHVAYIYNPALPTRGLYRGRHRQLSAVTQVADVLLRGTRSHTSHLGCSIGAPFMTRQRRLCGKRRTLYDNRQPTHGATPCLYDTTAHPLRQPTPWTGCHAAHRGCASELTLRAPATASTRRRPSGKRGRSSTTLAQTAARSRLR